MAFPPQVPTWEVYAGDDAAYTLTFTKEHAPASLSMFTGFEACWRADAASDPVALEVDATGADQGVIVVRIPAALCAVDGGQVREGAWDLQARIDGRTLTLVRGRTSWKADITR